VISIPPSASRVFIILAEAWSEASRGSTSCAGRRATSSLRRSRERVLAGPAGGSDFDNAGLVDGGRRQSQRVELVGLAPGGPSCRKAAAAPCAREDRPRCRTLLGRRSCSGVVLPLHRYGAFARRSVPHSSGRI
jgi:hypothetical protein